MRFGCFSHAGCRAEMSRGGVGGGRCKHVDDLIQKYVEEQPRYVFRLYNERVAIDGRSMRRVLNSLKVEA